MFARSILAVVALVASCAQAQSLSITDPSPSLWWVAGTQNRLAWTCGTSGQSAYTVVLSNSDKSILAAPLAFISNVPDYDCSFTVNPQQSTQAPSASYTLSFANILNISDVFASTQFEIKAAGSPYAVSPTSGAGSATGSTTNSAGSSSSTAGSKTGAAVVNYIPVGMSMAAAVLLGLVVA